MRARITAAELALAYELRQEGCGWKAIALGLSAHRSYIADLVRLAEREGLAAALDHSRARR